MGRHYSSGLKEKGLRQKLGPFFGRIGGENPQKKVFALGEVILAVYCGISIFEKRKQIAGQMTIKGRGPGKMPCWAASSPRAVGCLPMF